MSYEPDTNDIRIRQLKEEIAKIREEQFARAFPTNLGGSSSLINSDSGVPAPAIGVTSIIPAVIRITKDTGVIDLLNYDGQNTPKVFTIGEVITGQISGATATIGDIDIITSTTGVLTLVPSSITGTFQDNENLNGSIAGANIADADGTQFTQTGRGHLNAGAGSIIADADSITVPFEIHFIDNAQQDGQIIYMRAQDGQTIKLRRPTTNDATTGNLDIDESFNIIENALVFFQYQSASDATDTGGWVPLITDVSAVAGGTGAFQFPILYPREDLGTLNGVINLAVNQTDGHYKKVILDGDASLTFSNLPPSINGFKFYLETTQDATGGHVYTGIPSTVINGGTLLGQLQTASGAKTLWQFSTVDGGVNWHAQVIQAQGVGASNQTPWLSDIDANTFNLFNLDVLRYANGLAPGADGVIGFNTYGSAVENDTKLKWSIPQSTLGNPRFYEWQFDLNPAMALRRDTFGNTGLDMLSDGSIDNTTGISFFHLLGPALSSIIPSGVELRYDNGFGTGQGGFHGFRVANPVFPQFEIRENIIRSNVDLDMITNDIINIDQAQFDAFGGFNSLADHGERRITGGAQGIVMNIPKISPFAGGFDINFENDAQTDSDLEYSFEKNRVLFNQQQIENTLGLLFTNGGSLVDLFTHIELVGSNGPSVQTLLFRAGDGAQIFDLMEITGTEHNTFNKGGVKLFTDLNLQTQDIVNVDRLHFVPDGGLIGGNQYAIAVDSGDTAFEFNIPISREFSWRMNDFELATLDESSFHMRTNPFITNPSIITDGSFILGLTSPSSPFIDGESRLVNNAGSLDVEFFTGGNVVNLSALGSGTTSFIGFTADDDLDMGTFNIFNLDVLRFVVDGGVIGFNTYGISADPGDFSMNFSVPQDRDYIFQNNLEPIAVIDQTGIQVLANSVFADPIMVAREFTALPHSLGTTGLADGSWRKVGNDVIFGSGGLQVNLSTLAGGGADNLGNHIMTQALNNSNFAHFNWVGWTAGVGQAFDVGVSGDTWNLPAGDFYQWRLNGGTKMVLTEFVLGMQGLRIENVADPIAVLDVVNLQTLNAGLATVDLSQWSTFPAVSAVNMANFAFSNFAGWTAGVGQAFSVNPTNFTWDQLSATHFYEWNLGGFNEMQLSQTDLNMFNKQITNVVDPLNPQDVATRAFVLAQAGDASQWSTFPALQNVDFANNAILNPTSITGIANGGGFVWSVPGVAILGGTFGLNFLVDGFDQFDFRIGGISKAVFTTAGHALSGGSLNMTTQKIVNVVDPTAPQEVATKKYVDDNVTGGANLLPLNNVWTGINAFTGVAHSITSPFITIGDQISDTINLTGQVNIPFTLVANQIQVSDLVLNNDLNMQFFRITNLDPGFLGSDAVTLDQLNAIGGSSLLNQNNVWTGTNTWTNTASFNSSFIFIGDSQSDRVFNVADQDFSLTPRSSNDIDLGAPSSRWRDLYVDFVSIASPGLQVTGFSSFTNDVLVSGGGTLAVSGGGNLIVASPSAGVFTGALLPQGLFFHSGSQIGFFGAGLDTRNTVFDVTATGNPGIDSLLAIGAINSLMFALEDYGLINVL